MNDTELDNMLNTWKAPEAPTSIRAGLQSRFPAKRPLRLLGVRPRWVLAFAAAAGALAVGASLVQDGTIMSDSGPWDAGTHMQRTRIVHPLLAKFGWSYKGGLSTGWQWQWGKLVGSVYMFDKSTRAHYGYTWNAEPLGAGKYRFTVLPLDPSVLREEGPVAPLARSILPTIVGPGSTFEVDLYASGSERVYDRYELSGQPLPRPKPDNPDLITLTNPELYINGAFALDSGGVVEARGDRVFVQLRNRGEYALTLDPRGDTRFLLAGTARGNTIEFRAGGDEFRIACTAPITRSGDRGVYLYVKKDVNLGSSGFGGGGGPGSAPGGVPQ
jgi:hypothetical protein